MNSAASNAVLIGIDWGTSSLRAYLIDEKGASKKITSLIDEIADVNDKIDELEAEEFYNQLDDDDMMFESKKKVIKITESDLMRITNKVIKEQSKKIRRK